MPTFSLLPFYPFTLLPSQPKLFDDLVVFVDVAPLEIIEQLPPSRDHLEQPATRVVVLLVDLEMFGQLVDPLGEQGDLDARRTGIRIVGLVIANYFFFYFFYCCHKNRLKTVSPSVQ